MTPLVGPRTMSSQLRRSGNTVDIPRARSLLIFSIFEAVALFVIGLFFSSQAGRPVEQKMAVCEVCKSETFAWEDGLYVCQVCLTVLPVRDAISQSWRVCRINTSAFRRQGEVQLDASECLLTQTQRTVQIKSSQPSLLKPSQPQGRCPIEKSESTKSSLTDGTLRQTRMGHLRRVQRHPGPHDQGPAGLRGPRRSAGHRSGAVGGLPEESRGGLLRRGAE